jgi:hypothetical protein
VGTPLASSLGAGEAGPSNGLSETALTSHLHEETSMEAEEVLTAPDVDSGGSSTSTRDSAMQVNAFDQPFLPCAAPEVPRKARAAVTSHTSDVLRRVVFTAASGGQESTSQLDMSCWCLPRVCCRAVVDPEDALRPLIAAFGELNRARSNRLVYSALCSGVLGTSGLHTECINRGTCEEHLVHLLQLRLCSPQQRSWSSWHSYILQHRYPTFPEVVGCP